MNKFIRVTAIVGAALVALALLLLLVSIPLQGAVVGVKSEEILQYLPIFPVATFVNLFLLISPVNSSVKALTKRIATQYAAAGCPGRPKTIRC